MAGSAENTNTDLYLDLDVLEKQGTTTTSLGDLYGYAVFSEQFQDRMELQKKEHSEELYNHLENVFYQDTGDEIEEAFERVMSAETVSVVREIGDYNVKKDSLFSIIGFTLIGIAATTAVWLIIERIAKRSKRNATKINHA